MSSRIRSRTPGRCTLTTTSRPSRKRARWTCPIEAAAMGTGSNSAYTDLSLTWSSLLTMSSTCSRPNGSTSSCSRESAST